MTLRPPWSRLVWPAAFALAFCLLAWLVLARHGTPYGFDTGPHRWSVAHRPQGAAAAARAVTGIGTGPWPYLAAALGGWLAGGGRLRTAGRAAPRVAVLAVLVLLAGQALRTLLAAALHRARPPAADWVAHASGHAFPSGHTASSAMAAALLAWGLLRARPDARGRAAAALCGLLALAVGCTRVYLGVHWPSDVLGGWLFAACWLTALLPPLAAYADRTGRPDGQTDTP
ncbi:phosphatase PAP2 family protein [Streptomyces sp. NBC_00433]